MKLFLKNSEEIFSGILAKTSKVAFVLLLLPTLFLLPSYSYSQELDITGDGGNTFALRTTGQSSVWQSFYPKDNDGYKAFIQSKVSGDFELGSIGGDLNFYSGTAFNMRLNSNGELGLGTTTPSGKFEIRHTSTSGASGVPQLVLREVQANNFSRLKFANTGNDFWTIAAAGGSTDKFNIFYFDGTSGTNRIEVDATEGTTILGSENSGTIAALKVTTGTQTLLVDGNEIDSDESIHLNFNSNNPVNIKTNQERTDINMKHGSFSGANFGLSIENEGPNDNWWTFYTVNSNGDLDLNFKGSLVGHFDPSSGVYMATSDRNRKEDIRSLNNVLEKVMFLQPSVYKFIGDENNRDHLGFIAQDIEQYFPEVVKAGTVGDTEEELYTMDYSALGVIAITAVQEQQALIENQAKEIETLKEIIEELASRVSALEK